MKRLFTAFCALILLLSCFSGMVVQAAPVQEDALPAQAVQAVIAPKEGETALEPIACKQMASNTVNNTASAKTYKSAPMEAELGKTFLEYLQPYIAECAKEIPVSQFKIPSSAFYDVTDLIYYEAPELFGPALIGAYQDSGYLTRLTIVEYKSYSDTPAEYAAYLKKMQDAAEYLLRGVKDSGLHDVEKALILHDRLAAWTEYDLGIYKYDNYNKDEIYSAVGPLANQSGVCQGYSLAYMYLLDKVGIESDLCMSDALKHAWNIVYIGGVPYYTDVTWDDPTNQETDDYYDVLGRVYHDNFMRSYNGIRSTGHDANDYPYVQAGTTYDSDCYWSNANTAVELIGSNIFYLHKGNGQLRKRENNNWSQLLQSGKSYNYYGNYGYYGSLSSVGGLLLLSREKDVLLIDPATGSNHVIYTPCASQYAAGNLVGMKYEKNKIWAEIRMNGKSYRTSFQYVDADRAVQITKQPKDTTADKGKTAKVTVKASGEGLKYTWYYKNVGDSKFKKSSVTTSSYSVKMSSTVSGRQVYCVVSDISGNKVESNIVTLRMSSIKIITQPKRVAAPEGKAAKVTVKATGDGLTYTWYHKSRDAKTYKKSSVTGSTYAVRMSESADGRRVYCVVKDKYGTEQKTDTAIIYMGNPATIKTQPKSVKVAKGKTAKVTVKASGDGLRYTWYVAKKGSSSYTKSSVTKSTYSVEMSSKVNGRKVYCVVKDKYGTTVKTSTVTLTMGKELKITKQPVNTLALSGKTAKVTVKASGDGLSYTWYYANKGSSSFKKTSVKTASYSVKMSSSVSGRKVYCVIKDKYGNKIKTKTVTLTMFKSIGLVDGSYRSTKLIIFGGTSNAFTEKDTGITLKISSSGKVTLKTSSAGTGYKKGTFTYTLKYLKVSGETVYYQFKNSVETLGFTYNKSTGQMIVDVGNGCEMVFKAK